MTYRPGDMPLPEPPRKRDDLDRGPGMFFSVFYLSVLLVSLVWLVVRLWNAFAQGVTP